MMKFTKDRIIHEGRLLFNKIVDFFEFYFGDPIIKIIGFLMKFLNDAEVQRSLIDSAEKLAKRTTNKY